MHVYVHRHTIRSHHGLFLPGKNFVQSILCHLTVTTSCKNKIISAKEHTFQICKTTASRYYLFKISEGDFIYQGKHSANQSHKFLPQDCIEIYLYTKIFRWEKYPRAMTTTTITCNNDAAGKMEPTFDLLLC